MLNRPGGDPRPGGRRPASQLDSDEIDELWGQVAKRQAHWLWTGNLTAEHRPVWAAKRRRDNSPARILFELTTSTEIPPRMSLVRTCTERRCVMPGHHRLLPSSVASKVAAEVAKKTPPVARAVATAGDVPGRSSAVATTSTTGYDHPGPDSQPVQLTSALEQEDAWHMIKLARRELEAIMPAMDTWPDACVYCGDWATEPDHLLPRPWTGEVLRRYVPTVPACRSCNGTMGGLLLVSVEHRAWYIAKRQRTKHAKVLRIPAWSAIELAELGPILRPGVEAYARRRRSLLRRLAVLEAGGLARFGGLPIAYASLPTAS